MKHFKRVESEEGYRVQIGEYVFLISTFCFQKVGDTENMKFRVVCLKDETLSGEFDDFESVKNHLSKLLQEQLFDYMIMSI